MIDDSMPKLFGLDEVDVSKTVYVTEGPIDSMFVDNCIAMAGSDLAGCLLYTSPSPRDGLLSRMPSSA